MSPSPMKRVQSLYSSAAIVVLNTLVLLLALNAILSGAFTVRGRIAQSRAPRQAPDVRPRRGPDDGQLFNSDGSPVRTKKRSDYQLEWFDYGACPELPKPYVSTLLDDFYVHGRLGLVFEPWVGFSETEFNGTLLHVEHDRLGFPIRRTVNPAANGMPVVQVFVLGGSTTFGYNVSDEHTWPSYLSALLNERAKARRVEVTNYAHVYFNPSQEAALLADLLKSGHRPSLVVFMDGVNEPLPTDVPKFTEQMTDAFHTAQFPPSYLEQLGWIPMVRLANFFLHRSTRTTARDVTEQHLAHSDRHVDTAINGFRQGRDIARAIAGVYGVPTVFFLQPNTFYNYDLRLFRLSEVPQSFLDYRRFVIPLYSRLKTDPGSIDLSGLFEEWGHRKAIIDDVHYSPAFNRFLAQRVAQWIDVDSLQPGAIDEKAATGAPR